LNYFKQIGKDLIENFGDKQASYIFGDGIPACVFMYDGS
jgi:hypothetical protein